MSDTPDATFFRTQGVPDSLGISHTKTFPFYISGVNPNANGGCMCECPDPVGPYVVFPGDMLDVSNPRPVICAACAQVAVALLEGKPAEIPEAIELPETEVEEESEPDVAGL